MDIENWRRRIDEIDGKLLRLLNERAEHSIAIGRIKEKRNAPIYAPEREKEIIHRVISENPGPLSADSVRSIFERIIDESRKLEKNVSMKNKK